MNCQYILTGITNETFLSIYNYFQPRNLILSHQWHVSTQTFDIELSDKIGIAIANGNITICYEDKSLKIYHDEYIYLKCM